MLLIYIFHVYFTCFSLEKQDVKIRSGAVDDDREYLCDNHLHVHQVGYQYLTKDMYMSKYNGDAAFQDSVKGAFAVVVGGEQKSTHEGAVFRGRERFRECTREYGAWTISASQWNIWLTTFPHL